MNRQVLEVGVLARLLRHLRDVQLVAHVAVHVVAAGDRCDRLPREVQRDRNVAEEPTRRVGHDGALVADDEPVELELVEVALHRPEHPARDDHERDRGVADGAHGSARARVHRGVCRDQRAVEVARERSDVAREVVRKAQRPTE